MIIRRTSFRRLRMRPRKTSVPLLMSRRGRVRRVERHRRRLHNGGSEILQGQRTHVVAAALVAMWCPVAVRKVAQMDNASTFRGSTPPVQQHLGPVVGACFDL